EVETGIGLSLQRAVGEELQSLGSAPAMGVHTRIHDGPPGVGQALSPQATTCAGGVEESHLLSHRQRMSRPALDERRHEDDSAEEWDLSSEGDAPEDVAAGDGTARNEPGHLGRGAWPGGIDVEASGDSTVHGPRHVLTGAVPRG